MHRSVEEGFAVGQLTMVLIAIWMAMAPMPVRSLPPMVFLAELMIVSVPFAKVYPVGTVFAVVPLMIVTMVAIVVAGMITVGMTDYDFLGSASHGYCGDDECGSEEKKTEIFVC